MTALIIVARFVARDGNTQEVEALLRGFVEPSRGEDGCLFYDLHQEVHDSNAFVILDGWRDRTAFDGHAGSAHVAKTLAQLEPLLAAAPVITELERLS